MNTLEHKYRDDSLSAEELRLLKEEINSMTDEDIGQQIRSAWMDEEIDTTAVDPGRMIRLKAVIDDRIASFGGKEKMKRNAALLRWGQVAAVVLLPLFVLLSASLYYKNLRILSGEIQVSTQSGERAEVLLPDGTKVALNSNSRLAYHPGSFHKDERKLVFEGEGYFQVNPADNAPLLVNADGLQIKVLGTVFNLLVRETEHSAEVALEEGQLLLIPAQSQRPALLQAGRMAVVDRRTGYVRLTDMHDLRDHSAWRRGEMIFRHTRLTLVLRKIEINYGVVVRMDCSDYLNECFTGTLPADNLNEALEVLEKSFHLHATAAGRQVHFRCCYP
jgi:ferric-dicitrate binding protein FerR (iron transport regulator)